MEVEQTQCRLVDGLVLRVLVHALVRTLMNDAAAALGIHLREISFSRSQDA